MRQQRALNVSGTLIRELRRAREEREKREWLGDSVLRARALGSLAHALRERGAIEDEPSASAALRLCDWVVSNENLAWTARELLPRAMGGARMAQKRLADLVEAAIGTLALDSTNCARTLLFDLCSRLFSSAKALSFPERRSSVVPVDGGDRDTVLKPPVSANPFAVLAPGSAGEQVDEDPVTGADTVDIDTAGPDTSVVGAPGEERDIDSCQDGKDHIVFIPGMDMPDMQDTLNCDRRRRDKRKARPAGLQFVDTFQAKRCAVDVKSQRVAPPPSPDFIPLRRASTTAVYREYGRACFALRVSLVLYSHAGIGGKDWGRVDPAKLTRIRQACFASLELCADSWLLRLARTKGSKCVKCTDPKATNRLLSELGWLALTDEVGSATIMEAVAVSCVEIARRNRSVGERRVESSCKPRNTRQRRYNTRQKRYFDAPLGVPDVDFSIPLELSDSFSVLGHAAHKRAAAVLLNSVVPIDRVETPCPRARGASLRPDPHADAIRLGIIQIRAERKQGRCRRETRNLLKRLNDDPTLISLDNLLRRLALGEISSDSSATCPGVSSSSYEWSPCGSPGANGVAESIQVVAEEAFHRRLLHALCDAYCLATKTDRFSNVKSDADHGEGGEKAASDSHGTVRITITLTLRATAILRDNSIVSLRDMLEHGIL